MACQSKSRFFTTLKKKSTQFIILIKIYGSRHCANEELIMISRTDCFVMQNYHRDKSNITCILRQKTTAERETIPRFNFSVEFFPSQNIVRCSTLHVGAKLSSSMLINEIISIQCIFIAAISFSIVTNLIHHISW